MLLTAQQINSLFISTKIKNNNQIKKDSARLRVFVNYLDVVRIKLVPQTKEYQAIWDALGFIISDTYNRSQEIIRNTDLTPKQWLLTRIADQLRYYDSGTVKYAQNVAKQAFKESLV